MGKRAIFNFVLLAIANILIPLSIIVFATGFFPYKPFLPGLAEYEPLEFGPPPDGPFNKLVFMVVDALRSDFVFSKESGFQYTQQLIRDGTAVPFTANARAPTVTMPRIKSITTGSIPSFVDLILNIDEGDTSSSLAAQDTWLAQLKAKGSGKLLMYGDDTWLKLFPDTFHREDGTSSFFVSDYTEVDNNVTRNIAGELENQDWALMVLHYLGLDHIGHKSGPRSVNMVPKQHEMDGIVQKIFEAIETEEHLKSTLFVMCGDHGMNDAGNHGASSPGETSSALVFMSPKLKGLGLKLPAPVEPNPEREFEYYSKVEQSDLAPTLASLLGFPVPKNNLGAFITVFLPFWAAASDQVQVLLRNARQILQVVTAAFGSDLFLADDAADPCSLDASDVNELACLWRTISSQASLVAAAPELDGEWQSSMLAWLRKAQDLMSNMASTYDVPRLLLGQGLAVAALLTGLGAATMKGVHGISAVSSLLLIAVPYGAMMFASSYVEEEHHFWYWTSTLWLAYLGTSSVRRTRRVSSIFGAVTALTALRVMRGWNQTGQKFAGEPDIVKMILYPHPNFLWQLVGATYIINTFPILSNVDGLPFIVFAGFVSTLVSSGFSFKVAFTAEDAPELISGIAEVVLHMFLGQSLASRARVVFSLVGVGMIFAAYRSLTGGPRAARASAQVFHYLYAMLAMTQSRATNVPILLVSNVLLRQLESFSMTVPQITITSILLQFTTFFAYGGSNAISSIDLSSAYNGVSGFNVVAVGTLTFVSNWAGPIYWSSATNLLLLERRRQGDTRVFLRHAALLTTFATASVAFVMAACTALRTHLFIWTVFSPKYLYSMAWALGQHLAINLGYGGLLFWLGARGRAHQERV